MFGRTQEEIMKFWDCTEPCKVSVICATYNHELYIQEAIDSFLMQETDFPFEIIIHDDASTDDTPEIIKGYLSRYPDIIKPIFQKNNQFSKGGFKPSIYAVGYSKGEYVALCEGDDYWADRYKLAKQISFMTGNPLCSMSYHPAIHVMENICKPVGIIQNRKNRANILCSDEVILGLGAFYPTAAAVFNKEMVIRHLSALKDLDIEGDHIFAIAALCGGNVGYMEQAMSFYRKNQNSITQGYIKNLGRDSITSYREYLAVRTFHAISSFNDYTKSRYKDVFLEAKRRFIFAWMKHNIAILYLGDAIKINETYMHYLTDSQKANIVFRNLVKMLRLRWRID